MLDSKAPALTCIQQLLRALSDQPHPPAPAPAPATAPIIGASPIAGFLCPGECSRLPCYTLHTHTYILAGGRSDTQLFDAWAKISNYAEFGRQLLRYRRSETASKNDKVPPPPLLPLKHPS